MQRPLLLLCDDDIDDDLTLSKSWTYDPNGTMCHRPSGLTVSPDDGITCEGRAYRLSSDDIEVDAHSQLGCGSCGTVRRGVIKVTGEQVAIKTLRVDLKEQRELLLNEIRGLIQAEGFGNLVQWYAGFVSRKSGSVHVVLELMDCGSLADLRNRIGGRSMPPHILAGIVGQVCRGLDYLHSRRLLHRDVKPQNILLNRRGEVKLSDFGITKALGETMASTSIGTQIYMSPERCDAGSYALPADVWSVGMVVYELASGRHPFSNAATFPALLQKLCDEPEPRLSEADGFPASLCDFVARCLERDPTRRATATELVGHNLVLDGAVEAAIAEFLTSDDVFQ